MPRKNLNMSASNPPFTPYPHRLKLHDVAAASSALEQTMPLRHGLLLVSTPVEAATRAEKEMLREKFKLKSVVQTVSPQIQRYIHDGRSPGAYIGEQFAIEEILGFNICRIYVRHGAFAQNVVNGLPFWPKLKFQYNAATRERKDSDLVRFARDLVWDRDSIDDSYLVLVSSTKLIGRLFNEVLCKADMYPMLICGDLVMRDNMLLVFLLLLMIDVPFTAIEQSYLHMTEGLPLFPEDGTQTDMAQHLQKAGWSVNRTHWAKTLQQRLESRYGSVSAYFTAMGVTEATRNSIKGILLAPESNSLIDFP